MPNNQIPVNPGVRARRSSRSTRGRIRPTGAAINAPELRRQRARRLHASTASTAAATHARRRRRRCSAASPGRTSTTPARPAAGTRSRAITSGGPRCGSSPARTTGSSAASCSTRCAAAGRTPSRRTSYTERRRSGADLVAQTGLVGLPRRAGDRRLPALRVRRRVVHLDRRRQAVRHPVARRSGQRHADVAGGPPHGQGRRRHPVRRVPRSDLVLRRRRARPLRQFDGSFTGNAFADFLLGLPRFTGYILPAPDVNPFATYFAGLRPGRLAAARRR